MTEIMDFDEWLMHKYRMDSSNKEISPIALQAFKNIYQQEKLSGTVPPSPQPKKKDKNDLSDEVKNYKVPINDTQEKILKDASAVAQKSKAEGKLDINGFLKIAKRTMAINK